MSETLEVSSRQRNEFIDITAKVESAVRASKVKNGLCCVYVPHTTAGLTINENADPTVPADIMMGLERIVPARSGYQHSEGNSDAHIKSTLVGHSLTVPVENNALVLGTWQGIFFCEFDGPRRRKVLIKIIPS